MTSCQRRKRKTQVFKKILTLFSELFHHTLISCFRKQWCWVRCTNKVSHQKRSQPRLLWHLFNLARTWCKEDGLTRISSNNFHSSMKLLPRNLKADYKGRLFSSTACSHNQRDWSSTKLLSQMILNKSLNSTNKSYVLRLYHLLNWRWLPKLKEKMKLLLVISWRVS